MWWGTYPSRSTACWWARLKNFGRLISNLWICHDRWRAEWVGVWICGNVLLKHTHTNTHYLATTLHVPQQSVKVAKQKKRKRAKTSLHEETHKVSVHLPHPVSHVDHHVVEHAERVPHHVLSKHKRKRPAVAELRGHMFKRHYQLVNNPIMCTNIHAQITVC